MLPAHAGMIPTHVVQVVIHMGAPRTCGDDPDCPDMARDVSVCSPHMRDDPCVGDVGLSDSKCSPHMRG